MWANVVATLRDVMYPDVAAIGITNQRETILLWDRQTGQALHNAVVWQDRRTADVCNSLVRDGAEPMIRARTGLLLDPYFSATKLRWLLDNVAGARRRAEQGELAAGTVDTFLLWRLTEGRAHATDITNASRTMLFDIHEQRWDRELLELFSIPASILPEVHGNDHTFGSTPPSLVGRSLPICGMAGDQQAALIGQQCFLPGMVKSTYGTGCFVLSNIGSTPRSSSNRLLTTPAYRIRGHTAYAVEGSIFIAGAAIKWLRDRMGLIKTAEESAALAASVSADHGVFFVPAFVGLGAPHWRSDVRAAIVGMTLDTGPAHIARAALEAVAYQTCDLIDTMERDGIGRPSLIRIDGGMASNDWFAQFLADMLDATVERPECHEATARGAAILAGTSAGVWPDSFLESEAGLNAVRFEPQVDAAFRSRRLEAWRTAVRQVLSK